MRDARPFAFYGLEKQDRNPHWHGVIKLCSTDTKSLERICSDFDNVAELAWKKLVPAGTMDLKKIDSRASSDRFVDYVTKSVTFEKNFAQFIVPDEFSPQYPPITLVKAA